MSTPCLNVLLVVQILMAVQLLQLISNIADRKSPPGFASSADIEMVPLCGDKKITFLLISSVNVSTHYTMHINIAKLDKYNMKSLYLPRDIVIPANYNVKFGHFYRIT